MQTVCVGSQEVDERFADGILVQLLRTMEFRPFFFFLSLFLRFHGQNTAFVPRRCRSKIVNACSMSKWSDFATWSNFTSDVFVCHRSQSFASHDAVKCISRSRLVRPSRRMCLDRVHWRSNQPPLFWTPVAETHSA